MKKYIKNIHTTGLFLMLIGFISLVNVGSLHAQTKNTVDYFINKTWKTTRGTTLTGGTTLKFEPASIHKYTVFETSSKRYYMYYPMLIKGKARVFVQEGFSSRGGSQRFNYYYEINPANPNELLQSDLSGSVTQFTAQ